MSITITCQFAYPYEARQAAQRLRRRGYIVSERTRRSSADPLLVAYPYGTSGGNTAGNGLMAALPPLAGNGVMLHQSQRQELPVLSVLTDDVQYADARALLEALGGRIL